MVEAAVRGFDVVANEIDSDELAKKSGTLAVSSVQELLGQLVGEDRARRIIACYPGDEAARNGFAIPAVSGAEQEALAEFQLLLWKRLIIKLLHCHRSAVGK